MVRWIRKMKCADGQGGMDVLMDGTMVMKLGATIEQIV